MLDCFVFLLSSQAQNLTEESPWSSVNNLKKIKGSHSKTVREILERETQTERNMTLYSMYICFPGKAVFLLIAPPASGQNTFRPALSFLSLSPVYSPNWLNRKHRGVKQNDSFQSDSKLWPTRTKATAPSTVFWEF